MMKPSTIFLTFIAGLLIGYAICHHSWSQLDLYNNGYQAGLTANQRNEIAAYTTAYAEGYNDCMISTGIVKR